MGCVLRSLVIEGKGRTQSETEEEAGQSRNSVEVLADPMGSSEAGTNSSQDGVMQKVASESKHIALPAKGRFPRG